VTRPWRAVLLAAQPKWRPARKHRQAFRPRHGTYSFLFLGRDDQTPEILSNPKGALPPGSSAGRSRRPRQFRTRLRHKRPDRKKKPHEAGVLRAQGTRVGVPRSRRAARTRSPRGRQVRIKLNFSRESIRADTTNCAAAGTAAREMPFPRRDSASGRPGVVDACRGRSVAAIEDRERVWIYRSARRPTALSEPRPNTSRSLRRNAVGASRSASFRRPEPASASLDDPHRCLFQGRAAIQGQTVLVAARRRLSVHAPDPAFGEMGRSARRHQVSRPEQGEIAREGGCRSRRRPESRGRRRQNQGVQREGRDWIPRGGKSPSKRTSSSTARCSKPTE